MNNCEIEYRIFVDKGYVEWPDNESFVDYDIREFHVGTVIVLCGDRYIIEAVKRISQYSRNILVKKCLIQK